MDAARNARRENLAAVGDLRTEMAERTMDVGLPAMCRRYREASTGRPHDRRCIGLAPRQQGQGNGRQFVTRRFTPSMALRTVIRASHEWHEAVASHMAMQVISPFRRPGIRRQRTAASISFPLRPAPIFIAKVTRCTIV